MDVKFDTGIVPPLGVAGLEQLFKLDVMESGQSFFHKCDDTFAQKLGSAVRTYAKRTNAKFLTKRLNAGDKYGSDPVDAGGIAVWRM